MRYEYRHEHYILDFAYELQPLIDEMASGYWRVHTFIKNGHPPLSYDVLYEREPE